MWDIWVYRESVGWWIEESGYDDIRDASGGVEELCKKNKASIDKDKMQFALVPHGKPMAVPRWNH